MAAFVITMYNSEEKWTKIESIYCVSVCLFVAIMGNFPEEVKFRRQVTSEL